MVGAQLDEGVPLQGPGRRRDPSDRRHPARPQDVGRADQAGAVAGPQVHQLMDLQLHLVGERPALAVEDQVDRAGVVLHQEAAGAVEPGQMGRRDRAQHDVPAAGLREVPDQAVEVEGVREGHGGDEALAVLLGLEVQQSRTSVPVHPGENSGRVVTAARSPAHFGDPVPPIPLSRIWHRVCK